MLAPRKVLWSTPSSAVQKAFEVVPLSESDVIVDLGCGDGRVLLEWAKLYSRQKAQSSTSTKSTKSEDPTFIGIDTDRERIDAAIITWKEALKLDQIDATTSGEFRCANALVDGLWKDSATIIFLYLTPRGMRKLRPIMDECSNLRYVVSYMNVLPDAKLLKCERIAVPHQPDSAWPLYIYQFQD